MSVKLEIDNPNQLEEQLIYFLKQQKQELKEITVEVLINFLNSLQKKEEFQFEKKDIYKNLSTITSDDNEPRDKNIKLYGHVTDSAKYIHDLRRERNR